MLSFLKRLRFIYGLYNFLHKKQLEHNLPVYKKYGLNKKYFSSVSSRDFIHVEGNRDGVTTQLIQHTKAFRNLSTHDQRSLEGFEKKGYAILQKFFSEVQIDQVNQTIDQLLKEKKVHFRYGRKIMFAYKKSEALAKIGKDERLIEILSSLIGTNAVLFQSINFLQGSEQHTHSDSIHMTTFPLGKLIAVWVALEDIHEDNGPLHYYPGSHLLPYYLNSDYQNEGNHWLIGDKSYTAYEDMIESKIRESGLKKEVFLAKKGDILIWHANLSHGGEPHTNKNRTRKSMVFHYFGEDAICYHEITQRPALMDLE
jgi:phytanoyl-CoA hydroxylase